jgi:hypothetical protein
MALFLLSGVFRGFPAATYIKGTRNEERGARNEGRGTRGEERKLEKLEWPGSEKNGSFLDWKLVSVLFLIMDGH